MAIDVIAEEGWRIGSDASQLAIGQEAALHQSLESVADAQDQASSCLECSNCGTDLGIVDDICDEFAAAVRFVTGGEATAECKDVRVVYAGGKFIY